MQGGLDDAECKVHGLSKEESQPRASCFEQELQ